MSSDITNMLKNKQVIKMVQVIISGFFTHLIFNHSSNNQLIRQRQSIQCESQKRKPRFNLKSLKNKKTDHKTNNRE